MFAPRYATHGAVAPLWLRIQPASASTASQSSFQYCDELPTVCATGPPSSAQPLRLSRGVDASTKPSSTSYGKFTLFVHASTLTLVVCAPEYRSSLSKVATA